MDEICDEMGVETFILLQNPAEVELGEEGELDALFDGGLRREKCRRRAVGR